MNDLYKCCVDFMKGFDPCTEGDSSNTADALQTAVLLHDQSHTDSLMLENH